MRILFILLFLTACSTTITIKPNGEIIVEGPRKATIITKDVAISTSEMLMNNPTITALGTLGIQSVTEIPQ
jgi:hypothetical protein